MDEWGAIGSIAALIDGKDACIAQTQQLRISDRQTNHMERVANAAFIVEAVNAHESLLAQVRVLREALVPFAEWEAAAAATRAASWTRTPPRRSTAC
jgi:ethanolamine utilization microcompartment shell protein EutS